MNENETLLRRGLFLEYITLGWNVVGVVVVVYAALKAHSVALAGFGLDSLIEIGASTVVVWELTGSGKGREKRALRLIGAAFFALALYILAQSAQTLYSHVRPHPSSLGMAWLVVTFAAMVALAQGSALPGQNSIIRCCSPKGGSRWWMRILRHPLSSGWCSMHRLAGGGRIRLPGW